MPRPWSSDLQTIHQAYKRRDTLDIYLADDTVLNLSRGEVERESVEKGTIIYNNWIRSVDDLRGSFEQSVDRITVKCQNISSELGFNLASNLRLLDYAFADYGKIYQSTRNTALIEDIPQVLRGVLANAEVDEQNFKVELIVDYESLGPILASRGLSAKCGWTYKNGIECTSSSVILTCSKDRFACIKRNAEKDHGGFEYFEEPTSLPPGSGDNTGGMGGPCFLGETLVWTPQGEIPIGEMKKRFAEGKRAVYSFDQQTGEISEDEIEAVWEHQIPYTATNRDTGGKQRITGYFTLEFDHTKIKVTPEHRFLFAPGEFRAADKFDLDAIGKNTSRAFTDSWFDSKLKSIKWNSDKEETVWNLRVKKNRTYFANRCAVSNSKDRELE